VLEQQQPDHEAGLNPGPAVLVVERRDLTVDPVPIDLAGEQNPTRALVDDLVQPRPGQIRSSPSPCASSAASFVLRCTTEFGPQRKRTNDCRVWWRQTPIPCISNRPNQKQTPDQCLEPCSRTTNFSGERV
jgi:hypothetical protein